MGVRLSQHGRFIPIEKFYERVMYYKDKDDDGLLLNEYHITVLEKDVSMSFVSPSGLGLIKKNDKGDMYTTVLEFDEAMEMLKLYLRSKKIKKIKDEKTQ